MKKKRIISMLLAVMLILAAVPAMTFAAITLPDITLPTIPDLDIDIDPVLPGTPAEPTQTISVSFLGADENCVVNGWFENWTGTEDITVPANEEGFEGWKFGDYTVAAGEKITFETLAEKVEFYNNAGYARFDQVEKTSVTPSIPDVNVPEINPDINVPDVNVPEINPDINVPDVNVPEINPDINVPDVNVPEINPDINVPDVNVPEINPPVVDPEELAKLEKVTINYVDAAGHPVAGTGIFVEADEFTFLAGALLPGAEVEGSVLAGWTLNEDEYAVGAKLTWAKVVEIVGDNFNKAGEGFVTFIAKMEAEEVEEPETPATQLEKVFVKFVNEDDEVVAAGLEFTMDSMWFNVADALLPEAEVEGYELANWTMNAKTYAKGEKIAWTKAMELVGDNYTEEGVAYFTFYANMVEVEEEVETKQIYVVFELEDETFVAAAGKTLVVPADATYVNTTAVADMVPEGYEIQIVGDIQFTYDKTNPAADKEVKDMLYITVKKAAPVTVAINYYDWTAGAQIAEIEVEAAAAAEELALEVIMANMPEGYVLVENEENEKFEIRDGYVWVEVEPEEVEEITPVEIKIGYYDGEELVKEVPFVFTVEMIEDMIADPEAIETVVEHLVAFLETSKPEGYEIDYDTEPEFDETTLTAKIFVNKIEAPVVDEAPATGDATMVFAMLSIMVVMGAVIKMVIKEKRELN